MTKVYVLRYWVQEAARRNVKGMRVSREFLFDARNRIESRVKTKLVCSTDALDKFYLHKGGVIHLPYFNYESCDLGLALRSETKSGLKKLADEFALPFDEAAILG